MTNQTQTRLVHVVAIVDESAGTGKILYVTPSNLRSNATPTAGLGRGAIELVLRNGSGEDLARIVPDVRYDECGGKGEDRQGLIQQDIEVHSALASVQLVRNGEVLDTFAPEAAVPPQDVAAGMTLRGAAPEAAHKRAYGAEGIAPRQGVSYVVQARPDTGEGWQTLSVGRPTPEFEIDKNQFPAATKVDVRVIQHAGFERHVVEEREVSLIDD